MLQQRPYLGAVFFSVMVSKQRKQGIRKEAVINVQLTLHQARGRGSETTGLRQL